MSRQNPRTLGLLLALNLLVPAIAGAQAPWTVTVTPTLNPLPISFCGAVRLDIVAAAGGETPRNPTGARVTIADFDMAVTAPGGRAVVGHAIDVSHWEVCACQGAAVGTVGTITATYPAQALSERARVSGVAFQTTATFSLAKAKGETNPAACQATSLTAVIAAAGMPTTPLQSPTSSRTVTTTPIIDRPAAGSGSVETPITAAPVGARAPASPGAGAPPPSRFRLLTSVPLIATFAWDSMPNASSYSLRREGAPTPIALRAGLGQAAAQGTADTIPDPRIMFRYTLIVTYADATTAESPPVDFTSPPLANPPGFTARDRGLGNVDFQWQPVGGALRYRLDGPGLPGTGFYVSGTATSSPKIPAGPNSWKLTALYQQNFADYASPSVASAIVRVLPPHLQPWLSKNNGTGSSATVQAPKRIWSGASFCPLINEQRWGWLETSFNPLALRWLGQKDQCEETRIGLQQWVNLDMPLWGDLKESGNEAIYGNAIDLGVGRRTRCAQGQGIWPPLGLTTTCYATAHGVVPGQPGFNDFNTITHPDARITADFILAMVITKDASGSTFLVFLRDSLRRYGHLAESVSLDTEGPKYLPHACLACHGGKYNTTTRKVDGASFLPLDPGLLVFASPADQADQEEKMREMNAMIAASDPTSAVAAYIRGLYGNAVTVPGTVAKVDFVPQSWQPQAGFYRSVVKPYCAMCHLAGPVSWNFASWQNFEDNKALIHTAVCRAKTMPHAELQFKAFWTHDTGPIYTPGLLATTLGYPSCQ